MTPEWTLGDRLRKARESAGIGSAQMAKELGVDPSAISRWERRGYEPRRAIVMAYAHRCGVTVEWLEHGLAGVTIVDTRPMEPDVRSR